MGKRRASVRLCPENVDQLETGCSDYYENISNIESTINEHPCSPKKFLKLRSSQPLSQSTVQQDSQITDLPSVEMEKSGHTILMDLPSMRHNNSENDSILTTQSQIGTESYQVSNVSTLDLTATPEKPLEDESTTSLESTDITGPKETHITKKPPGQDEKSDTTEAFYGNLFSKPFTNPFQEALASKPDNIFKMPSTPLVPQGDSIGERIIPKSDELQSNTEEPVATLSYPTYFTGEEKDVELFSQSNVVLLKLIKTNDNEEDKSQYKFKKVGKGHLRILQDFNSSKNIRILVRQNGTSTLLLNSPISLIKKTEMFGDYLKFIGLDSPKGGNDNVAIAVYSMKFEQVSRLEEMIKLIQTHNT